MTSWEKILGVQFTVSQYQWAELLTTTMVVLKGVAVNLSGQ